MKRLINQQKGFTLIEMIAVLIIVGIMAVFAGFGIITAVNGYMFSKNNAAISGKAQMALARIHLELVECVNCTWVSGATVSMPIRNTLELKCGNDCYNRDRYIRLNNDNGNIEISTDNYTTTDILIDSVNAFTMKYNTDDKYKSIVVTMSLNHPDSATPVVFSTNVYPRSTAN